MDQAGALKKGGKASMEYVQGLWHQAASSFPLTLVILSAEKKARKARKGMGKREKGDLGVRSP